MNAQLHRIQRTSRFGRLTCNVLIGFTAFTALIWFALLLVGRNYFPVKIPSGLPVSYVLLLGTGNFILCFWGLTILRTLFQSFENQILFSRDTVQMLRKLGWWNIGSIGLSAFSFLLLIGSRLMGIEGKNNFNLSEIFDFRSAFIAFSLFLFAWVMDEGRKLKEENDLTV